jgi:DtxR family Mn-dependent transcriptional regulator
MENSTSTWVILAGLVALVAALWPDAGLFAQIGNWRELRRRELLEDALKHIFAWEQGARNASPESLAGGLSISQSRVLRLLTGMEANGLVQSFAGGLRLTSQGQRLALQVVRAHRLWERYLADDAGMPMARLHQAAEKAEHQLSGERLDALDAHLGHPEHDPHGDPIPRSDGSLAEVEALALTDWPLDQPARVAHIEDEPDVIFRQILAAGVRPGSVLRVLENSPERLVISDGEQEHRLAHVVAANIQVAAVAPLRERPVGVKRLSELAVGAEAEVVELDSLCRGFSRRRLLDLGLTRDAKIEAALENTFGDPRAFRIRGTLIALRAEQAAHVWVKVKAAEGEHPVNLSAAATANATAERTMEGIAEQPQ